MHTDDTIRTMHDRSGPARRSLGCLGVGLSVLLTSLMAGCVSNPSTKPAEESIPVVRSAWRQVHTTDASLRRILTIGTHDVHVDRNGLLHVEVPVRNETSSALNLQAQIVFLGAAGVETNDETVRRFITVPQDGAFEIHAKARTSSATDYRVYLWNAER